MAERKLVVQILGDEKDLLRAFRSSTRGTKQFEAQMTGVSRSVRNVFAAAGVALGAAGIVRALRDTVGAAISFESSFAGVRKTVDATEPQLQALAQSFRRLALEIPVSVDELNRIGEAAGQLGIQRAGILDFTKTVAALGATTNLASEQAADALARLANITQTPQDQFDNLGSVIADLGNKLAATESEIVDFGVRIAAAGKIVGLSVDQTLAIAGAFSSVGVEAEAGGTAVSKVFIALANAAQSGGKKLETFANTAGTSSAEFRRAFEQDAGGAFVNFVQGLARIDEEGGNVFQTLKSLGLTDQRLIRAFLSISQSGDLLNRSLAIGSRAWEQNSALQIEAAKRYETTASKLQIFQNRVNDLQITLGNVLAPALLDIVTPLGEWLEQTKNQERVQRALIDTMKDARSVFEGVRAVVQPLAEATKALADRMGGLNRAVELLLVAMVASKVVNFGLALTGLGTAAAGSRVKVNALRLSLLKLGAIGVIAVGIEVILNKDKIDAAVRGPGGLLDDLHAGFLKGGGSLELPVGINAAQLNKIRNDLAAIKGDGDIVVKALDAAIQKLIEAGKRGDSKLVAAVRRSRQAAKARAQAQVAETRRENARGLPDVVDADPAGAESTARRARSNFKKLMNRLDLELTTALGSTALADDISALRQIEAAIVKQIAEEGKTFRLSKQLIETRNQIASALASQAEETKQKAIDAWNATFDALSLKLEMAESTKSLADDQAALRTIEQAIVKRIAAEGRTTELLRQLFQNRQQQAEIQRQLTENAQAQRQRQAAQRQGRQFEVLGLTEEGGARTPGAGALRKRLSNLREQLKGTALDTEKTRSQLANIAKVLSGDFGKVGKEVRNAILGMFNDIAGALDKGGKGPLTKTTSLNSKKILAGMGLSPEEIRELRGRLSNFNSSGVGLAGANRSGTSGSFSGGQNIIVETTINLDGKKIASVVKKHEQKDRRRNPQQKRGPNRIGGV